MLSVDRSKMRLYDADESDQTLSEEVRLGLPITPHDTPIFDKTKTAERFKDFKIE